MSSNGEKEASEGGPPWVLTEHAEKRNRRSFEGQEALRAWGEKFGSVRGSDRRKEKSRVGEACLVSCR